MAVAPEASALPHWDMTAVYPGLDSTEFERAFGDFVRDLDDLTALFDAHGVGGRPDAPSDAAPVATFEEVVARYNVVLDDAATLRAYINGFVAVDSRDDLAQARLSAYQREATRLAKLGTRFTAWIGSLDIETLIAQSVVARDHAFPLRRGKEEAAHLMSPEEEALAADLNLVAGTAWAKLYDNVTSQIMVRLEVGGPARDLPMPAVRNLAFDPDRTVRRGAYEAELAAWRANAVPIAAALNSVKGEVNTLVARRGWDSPLAEALFGNHIDRETLDAMLQAATAAFPDFRRYLRAKARALGLPVLAWYDLFAPLPGAAGRAWDYDAAGDFIAEQFAVFSPRMRELAERAGRERWIDAEPRPGKQGGAFCMRLRGDESRILTNYTPVYSGVSTLAHELGHAYHNLNTAARTALQRRTPMTLAETASIFCESVVREAALREAGEREQLEILEGALQDACQVVVDITSRFLFERRLFAARQERALSVAELNALMLAAQQETYGDGLDPDALHPFMWAAKGHYYSTARSYYNFPYMFGLLFGLGLYARYREDPDGFRAAYDNLLASTGLADAATLAAGFGIDIRAPSFWRASLDVVRADIDRFEALAAQA